MINEGSQVYITNSKKLKIKPYDIDNPNEFWKKESGSSGSVPNVYDSLIDNNFKIRVEQDIYIRPDDTLYFVDLEKDENDTVCKDLEPYICLLYTSPSPRD